MIRVLRFTRREEDVGRPLAPPAISPSPQPPAAGSRRMEIRLDILDEQLEAIEGADDRERLARYVAMWRDGLIDPLRDPGTVLIVELDDGPRPRRPEANEGLGAGTAAGRLALAADQHRQVAGLGAPTLDPPGGRRAPGEPLLAVVPAQAGVQVGRVPGGQRGHVGHAEVLEHQAEHGAEAVDPRQ